MIDVAQAVDYFSDKAILIKQDGTYNEHGEWERNEPQRMDIEAVIQPAKGNDLRDMPEGIRMEAGWLCWSRTPFNNNDLIESNGVVYKVIFTWPWKLGGFIQGALGKANG